jgi:hypothetical protein
MKKTKYTSGLIFTIGIFIVLIVALVWRKKITEGFAFNVTGNRLGTDTTTYYIDVYYAGPKTSGPQTAVASKIVVDSRLKDRLGGAGPVLTADKANISLNVGSELDNLPINLYVYYASGNMPLSSIAKPPVLTQSSYRGYDLQVTQNNVISGNLFIPTAWTTLAKSGFYSGNMATGEYVLARIYLTFLNSSYP